MRCKRKPMYRSLFLNGNRLYMPSNSYSTAVPLFFSACASSRPLMSLGANCVVMLRGHIQGSPNRIQSHSILVVPRIRGLSEFAGRHIYDWHPKRPCYCWAGVCLLFLPCRKFGLCLQLPT